jgi:hypothetical protein
MPGELITAPEGGFPTPEAALASLGPLHERLAEVTDRTPGTVLRAFDSAPAAVSGIKLPPVTMQTWRRLEKIKSPFLDPKATELTIDDMMRTFYVLANPPAEVGEALRSDAALDTAVEAFAATVPLSALPTLAVVIAEHIAGEFEPKADLNPPSQEGNGGGPKAVAAPSSATEPAAG